MATLSVQIISSTEEFSSLESEWNALLSCSATDNIFLRWEWLFTWWKIFGEKPAQLQILLVKQGETLIGIAPFYVKIEKRFGFLTERTLLFLGSGEKEEEEVFSEYLDIICKAGEEEAVIQSLMEFIRSQNLCDAIILFNILSNAKTVAILQQICVEQKIRVHSTFDIECPFISLPSNWEDYLKTRTSSMRYKIRSDRRQLEAMGTIRLDKMTCLDDFESNFQELVRLHKIRWVLKQEQGTFENPKFTLFHQTIMPILFKNEHLQLWILSLFSKNIAALYNIQYNNKIYFYQAGLDPLAVPKSAVGLIISSYCIEEAIRSKRVEYDFMGGGGKDSYKKRWTDDFRIIGSINISLNATARFLHMTSQIVKEGKRELKGFLSKNE